MFFYTALRYYNPKHHAPQVNEKYLCVLMEALTGDQGDIRMVALTDLQKNSAIANILPDMVAYLQETVRAHFN